MVGSVTTAGIYETEWAALGSEDQSAHKSTRSQHKQVPQIFSRVLVLRRGCPEGGLWNMGGGVRLVPATAGWSLVSSETPPGRSPRKPRRLVALQRQGEGLRWEHTPWGFLLGQAAALLTDVVGSALDLLLPAPLPGGDLAC